MLQNNEGAARGWQRESESTSYANEFSVIVAVDAAATVAVAAVREGCFSFFLTVILFPLLRSFAPRTAR